MTLTFYTNPMSRGRIARGMLEETGAPYETVLVDWQDRPDALLAANPLGKVPTIVHDGRTVSEAAAICLYLADAFPDAGLAPTADERADYYRWTLFCAGPLEAAVTDRNLGLVIPAEREAMVGYGNLERTIATLEQAVARHKYIAGGRFTAADVYVGSAVGWFTQFGVLPKEGAFADYLARLWDRPTWVRARETDDALMTGR